MKDPTETDRLTPAASIREPYVGDGVDGCLRSAQIDREEADCLDLSDPRYAEALASAERWEQQAVVLASAVRRPETERRGATGVNSAPGHGIGR